VRQIWVGPADGPRWPRASPGSTIRGGVRWLIVASLAVGAGVAVAVSPLSLGVIGGSIIAIWLVAIGRQSIALFHGALIVLLTGYAFMGKGFAYVGLPPIYVGEIVLLLAGLATIHSLRRARFSIPLLLLALYMLWGLIRTVPYLGTYGLFALRDGVTWEYGLFAFAVALTVQREHVDRVVDLYRRGALLLVWWLPVAAVLTFRFYDQMPKYPGSPVGLVFIKGGDAGVQLAGIAAFVLLGLYTQRDARPVRVGILWVGWFISAGLAALNRGAMLAVTMAGACLLFAFSLPRVLAVGFVGATIFTMLLIVNPEIDIGLDRKLSVGQVVANVASIAGSDSGASLQPSKDWRLAWWGKVYGYTVDGPYLLVGKGFGINLATEDGFQVDPQESLRAPHNTHVEILARAGVPGLALWVLFQLAYAGSLLRAAAVARRIGELKWIALLGWVFVYWLAAIVNGSFDVYLGAPQGGIWFWSMIGLGLALVRLVDARAADPGARDTTAPPDSGALRNGRPALQEAPSAS
jgi:hypothetical protein